MRLGSLLTKSARMGKPVFGKLSVSLMSIARISRNK
jgi:hypothetical protein